LTKLIVNLIMIVKGGQNQTIKDQNEKTQKISGGFKVFFEKLDLILLFFQRHIFNPRRSLKFSFDIKFYFSYFSIHVLERKKRKSLDLDHEEKNHNCINYICEDDRTRCKRVPFDERILMMIVLNFNVA